MTRIATSSLTLLGAVLVVAISSGCSQDTESQVPKPVNAERTPMVANNAANAPVRNDTPPPSANNSTGSANGNKSAPTAAAPAPQIGSGGEDFSLFTQIRSGLAADKELSTAVIIDVKEGAVTLSGTVSSQAQRAKAEQITQNVKGIKSLKNNLRVAS